MPTPAEDAQWQDRLTDLDRLAGELADQRLQLAEQWERLVQTQHRWQGDRDQAAAELETVGRKLEEQEQTLVRRQQEFQDSCEGIRSKHQELVRLRQHLVGWHSRLRTRESSWESERGRLLDEVRQREKLVQDHLHNLVEIRRRWSKNRRQEVARLQAERGGCESLRQEYAVLRLEWQRRTSALEDEKRSVAEKSLALEQFRQETITHSGNSPAAEHRVERLRRNWLTQNAAAIRAVAEERKVLETELSDLEKRFTVLQKRSEEVVAAETVFAEKHAAWEHKQALLAARQAQMQQELNIAQAQRQAAEHQLAKMQDEVERIARTLLDEPEPPALLTEQAA
jgi:chromosome segregation ATPase